MPRLRNMLALSLLAALPMVGLAGDEIPAETAPNPERNPDGLPMEIHKALGNEPHPKMLFELDYSAMGVPDEKMRAAALLFKGYEPGEFRWTAKNGPRLKFGGGLADDTDLYDLALGLKEASTEARVDELQITDKYDVKSAFKELRELTEKGPPVFYVYVTKDFVDKQCYDKMFQDRMDSECAALRDEHFTRAAGDEGYLKWFEDVEKYRVQAYKGLQEHRKHAEATAKDLAAFLREVLLKADKDFKGGPVSRYAEEFGDTKKHLGFKTTKKLKDIDVDHAKVEAAEAGGWAVVPAQEGDGRFEGWAYLRVFGTYGEIGRLEDRHSGAPEHDPDATTARLPETYPGSGPGVISTEGLGNCGDLYGTGVPSEGCDGRVEPAVIPTRGTGRDTGRGGYGDVIPGSRARRLDPNYGQTSAQQIMARAAANNIALLQISRNAGDNDNLRRAAAAAALLQTIGFAFSANEQQAAMRRGSGSFLEPPPYHPSSPVQKPDGTGEDAAARLQEDRAAFSRYSENLASIGPQMTAAGAGVGTPEATADVILGTDLSGFQTQMERYQKLATNSQAWATEFHLGTSDGGRGQAIDGHLNAVEAASKELTAAIAQAQQAALLASGAGATTVTAEGYAKMRENAAAHERLRVALANLRQVTEATKTAVDDRSGVLGAANS